MGTIVYGSCVEPGGMELDDDRSKGECPDCKAAGAEFRHWQSCHGGAINSHWSVYCGACGHSDGDGYDEP